MAKNLPADAGDIGDVGLVPGPGRFPGEGNGKSLQYSCLGNTEDGEAKTTTAHGVTKESDSTLLNNNKGNGTREKDPRALRMTRVGAKGWRRERL